MKRLVWITVMSLVFSSVLFGAENASGRVDEVLSGLSVREKVAQLFVMPVDAHDTDAAIKAKQMEYVKEGIGGVIVMDGSLIPFAKTLNELQAEARIPLMVALDGEWGVSMRFPEFPYFPRQMQLGALSSPQLVYEMGRIVAKEMKLVKMGVNYAPDVDINCNPKNPVINARSFGEDREKVAQYGWAYAKGMQDEGVSACAKHFPGHGDTSVDSHRGMPVLEFTRSRLDSLEMYPFRQLVSEGVDMVMMAHMSVPALDPSGTPTSVSKPVVDILRKDMGFDGLVVTDALGMEGVSDFFNDNGPQVCLAAYKAGADVLLMPINYKECINLIVSKLESGELPMDELDVKVRRVLAQKERQGLLEPGFDRMINIGTLEEEMSRLGEKELIQKMSDNTVLCAHSDGKKLLKGKVAYLALGAGEEKRVPNMDDDIYKPREGEGGGPAAYGARRGVGESGAEKMGQILGCDSYFLPRDFTLEDIEEMRSSLKGYKTVIVGFHDTDSRPQNNFGIKEPAIYDYIGSWSREQRLVGAYFGSPYALDVMPWFRNFGAFFIGWADNAFNCKSVAEVILGQREANGIFPVSAAGIKAGTGNIAK